MNNQSTYEKNYENYCYFTFNLKCKKVENDVVKTPQIPRGWRHIHKSYNKNHNALALICGKKSGLYVVDFDNKDEFEKLVFNIPISSAFSFIMSAKFSSVPAIPSAIAIQASLPDVIIMPLNRSSTETLSLIIINIDE